MSSHLSLDNILKWAFSKKRVYCLNEGDGRNSSQFGQKGANLIRLNQLGSACIPEGCIITSDAFTDFVQEGASKLDDELIEEIAVTMRKLGVSSNHSFGGVLEYYAQGLTPLLLSVRLSTSNTLDKKPTTILNLGINDQIVDVIAKSTENPRFAWDLYRRFLQTFGQSVMGVQKSRYDEIVSSLCSMRGLTSDTEFSQSDLQILVQQFKKLAEVPSDPMTQLLMAVESFFKFSVQNQSSGVAVILQRMVFGNINSRSGVGYVFTRCPATGDCIVTGEYLKNAEGEDIFCHETITFSVNELRREMPSVYESLRIVCRKLERIFKDIQEIEFTIENGTLYILQSLPANRSPLASMKIACDFVDEDILNERDALFHIRENDMLFFKQSMIDPSILSGLMLNSQELVLCQGFSAASGTLVGALALTEEDVIDLHGAGKPVIYVVDSLSSLNMPMLKLVSGVISKDGTMSSLISMHFRRLLKPAIINTLGMLIEKEKGVIHFGAKGQIPLSKGDLVTIDGSAGRLYNGILPLVSAGNDMNFKRIINWTDEFRNQRILAQCSTLDSVIEAFQLGCDGVTLSHFGKSYIDQFQLDYFTNFDDAFATCQSTLVDWYYEIFSQSSNKEFILNLYDPFAMKIGSDLSLNRNFSKHPGIVEVQVKSFLQAASKTLDLPNQVYTFMIPPLSTLMNLKRVIDTIKFSADSLFQVVGFQIPYKIGCVFDTPRKLLLSKEILNTIGDVLCIQYDTSRITELTFGITYDDYHQNLEKHPNEDLLLDSPFESIEAKSVGQLLKSSIDSTTEYSRDVQTCATGSFCANSHSVTFFDEIKMKSLACSLDDVPSAKLFSARAHISDLRSKLKQRQVNLPTRIPIFPLTPLM